MAIILGYEEMLLNRLGLEDPSRKCVEQIVAAGWRSPLREFCKAWACLSENGYNYISKISEHRFLTMGKEACR